MLKDNSVEPMITNSPQEKLINALLVVVRDPNIKRYLQRNDPMALRQAREALTSNGVNPEPAFAHPYAEEQEG